MSDISNLTISSSNKRRLDQIDDAIEYLTQEVNNINNFVFKSEFECSLMTVKMKREKVKALSAFAKSQVILADMEVMIAEGDLYTDIERLRNFKRLKIEHEEGQTQKYSPQKRNTKSAQTMKIKSDKKKRSHSSSRKSPVDLSSDETLMVPTIHESTRSFVETSQTSKISFSQDLFEKSPANKSDSEVSLSNSIKAAFNEPYTNTQKQELIKKSPAKKNKLDKKVESKNKSKHVVKQTESPKAVAELKKIIFTPTNLQNTHMDIAANDSKIGQSRTMVSNTYAPVRHNMPAHINQPSTSNGNPVLYLNPATQTSIQYHAQKAGNIQTYGYYGSKQ